MADVKRFIEFYLFIAILIIDKTKAYDLSGFNYSTTDLARYQRELQHELTLPRTTGRSLSNPYGSCGCDLTDEEAYCKCCAGFSWFGTPHEGCIKAGIEFTPNLAAVLTLNYDDYKYEIRFEPEVCFPLVWFGLIKICLSLYHSHFCKDPNNIWMSALTVCIQLDVVILIPVISVDFNCIAVKNGAIGTDDSFRTDKGGFVVYKLGHGFVRSGEKTTIIVGNVPQNMISETGYKKCIRKSDYTVECTSKTHRIKQNKK